MNGNGPVVSLSKLLAVAETARQLRDVKVLIDDGLDLLKRAWPLLSLLAAGWMYMMSDDERRALVESVADEVGRRLSVISLQRA